MAESPPQVLCCLHQLIMRKTLYLSWIRSFSKYVRIMMFNQKICYKFTKKLDIYHYYLKYCIFLPHYPHSYKINQVVDRCLLNFSPKTHTQNFILQFICSTRNPSNIRPQNSYYLL